jgi:hypothetical protein
MVYMMLFNLLFLFRKTRIMVEGVLDLVQPPNMAHSLLYSTIRANTPTKKDHFSFPMIPNSYSIAADKCRRSLKKKVLDNFVFLWYNIYITIEKGQNARQPYAALPVHISPFQPLAGKNTLKD